MLCFSPERFGADVSSLSPSSEQTLDQQGLIWYVFRRKVWFKADVSSVSPSSEQTLDQQGLLWYVFHPRGLVYSRRLERSPNFSAVCSDEGLTSAIQQISWAKNIPYQPLLIKNLLTTKVSLLVSKVIQFEKVS